MAPQIFFIASCGEVDNNPEFFIKKCWNLKEYSRNIFYISGSEAIKLSNFDYFLSTYSCPGVRIQSNNLSKSVINDSKSKIPEELTAFRADFKLSNPKVINNRVIVMDFDYVGNISLLDKEERSKILEIVRERNFKGLR